MYDKVSKLCLPCLGMLYVITGLHDPSIGARSDLFLLVFPIQTNQYKQKL